MKIPGTVILLSLLAAGCSHHDNAAPMASVTIPSQAPAAAGPKHDAQPTDEAVHLTYEQTIPVSEGEQCLVAAASVPPGVPLEAFAFMQNNAAYIASNDPFTHKDMAKAIQPVAAQLIAQDNPSGTRYISYTTPVTTRGQSLLNPYQETWQHYHGFPIASGYMNGATFPHKDVYVCDITITNSTDFTTLRVGEEDKARAVSKLLDDGVYSLRFLAQVDGWNPPPGNVDGNPNARITVNAHLLKIQLLDSNGHVMAEDTKTPNTGTP